MLDWAHCVCPLKSFFHLSFMVLGLLEFLQQLALFLLKFSIHASNTVRISLHHIYSFIVVCLSIWIIFAHVHFHIVLGIDPTVFNWFIGHLVLLQSIWAIHIDLSSYLLLCVLQIFKCIVIALVNIHMIFLNVFSSLISDLVKLNSIRVFFGFQSVISITHGIHFVFLLIMHILHKSLSSLHVFNSFRSSFFLFLQLDNSGLYHYLLFLHFLMQQMSLHHFSISSHSKTAHSTCQILPLLLCLSFTTWLNWTLFQNLRRTLSIIIGHLLLICICYNLLFLLWSRISNFLSLHLRLDTLRLFFARVWHDIIIMIYKV